MQGQNPVSKRVPHESRFCPVKHFVFSLKWTQRKLPVCRASALPLPHFSLSTCHTVCGSIIYQYCTSFLYVYLSSLHCVALRWGSCFRLSSIESPKEDKYKKPLLLPPNFVLDSCTLFNALTNPEVLSCHGDLRSEEGQKL